MKSQSQPLWINGAPGALGNEPADVPTLTPYFAKNPTGAAMVVCPGGGYHAVVDHEKGQVAEWLNEIGIHAFVLEYRVAPRYKHPAMLHDVARAVRTVRARAAEWKVDPNRIGVIGFSAGGHLASTISVHYDAGNGAAADPIDRVSSRPDLAVLVYPVITYQSINDKPPICTSILGPDPATELFNLLSTEQHVTANTPPTFLFHRQADPVVPVQHPLMYAMALAKWGVLFEMHVYEGGKHGTVWEKNDPIAGDWPERLRIWLRNRKF